MSVAHRAPASSIAGPSLKDDWVSRNWGLTFQARDFVRTGLVLTVIAFALVMFLGAAYWHWLGYV